MSCPVTPWNLRPDPELARRPLPPVQEELLDLVLLSRALWEEDTLLVVLPDELRALLAAEVLHRYPSPWGPVVVPGPAGLLRAGRAPRNRPSPSSAPDHAYVARAAAYLEQERGWTLEGARGRTLLAMRDLQGAPHLLAGRARGHSARSLWRLVSKYRMELSKDQGSLVIFTPDLRRARCVKIANPWCVEVIIARPPNPPRDVQLPPAGVTYAGRRRRVRPTTGRAAP